ncbi:MAG TPA: hypothetical protein VGF30_06015 [Bacteroidia bacterium]
MKYLFLIAVALFFSIISSCGNQAKYTSQVTSLDSLRIELDKKLAVFSAIDTAKIGRYVKTYEGNVSWIEQNIKDTVSVDYLNALKNYRGVNEPLEFIRHNYSAMIKDAEYSKEQLNKLSADMKNSVIDEEKAYEYYTIEKLEAQKIMDALTVNHELSKNSIDTFDKYNNEIEKLINKYKSESGK